MAQNDPTAAVLTVVDGPVMLQLEKQFTESWRPDLGGWLHCSVGEAGYAVRFHLRTLVQRPSDGVMILEAAIVDLEEVRKRGVSIGLPALESVLRETGWTRAPPWKIKS